MILVDFSSSAITSITVFKEELKKDDKQVKDLIRHVILSTLVSYKKKFGAKYGQLVLCCDGRNYWRKEVFPNYKCKRKAQREDSDIPWKLVFDTMTEMRNELKEHFPYKIIHNDRAEADDCIAILAKMSQTCDLAQDGIFMDEPQPVLIVAADHDYAQLQKWDNVRQWSPKTKKFIDVGTTALREGSIIHIVKGDTGDSVPNLFSDDNVFLDERRQKSVMQPRLDEFLEKGFEACRSDEERRNWQRNEQLVSFDFIPDELEQAIISCYNDQNPKMNRMGIFNYLTKNRCRLLLDSISDF